MKEPQKLELNCLPTTECYSSPAEQCMVLQSSGRQGDSTYWGELNLNLDWFLLWFKMLWDENTCCLGTISLETPVYGECAAPYGLYTHVWHTHTPMQANLAHVESYCVRENTLARTTSPTPRSPKHFLPLFFFSLKLLNEWINGNKWLLYCSTYCLKTSAFLSP